MQKLFSFFTRHTRRHYRVGLVVGWVLLLGGTYLSFAMTSLDVTTIAFTALTALTTQWWGLLVFLAAYLLRPLLLLPVSIFSVVSGVVFGFWIGLIVSFVGILISGVVAYVVGRWFGRSFAYTRVLPDQPHWMSTRPFEIILGLHLSLISFDLINYTAGAARLHFPAFFLGTALGSISGVLSLTALGASLDIATVIQDGVSVSVFDVRYLALSAVVFVLSIIGAALYRRWMGARANL